MLKLLFTSLLISSSLSASIVVIGHPETSLDKLSQHDLKKIYLSRMTQVDGIGTVYPLDLDKSHDIYELFYSEIVGKSVKMIEKYRVRLRFTGHGKIPKKVDRCEDAKAYVSKNPNAIAYIKEEKLDDSVKVIYRLKN